LKKTLTRYLLLLVFIILNSILSAQDTTQSLAFKHNRPHQSSPYFYRPDLAYQIWQQFRLTQEANAGDPLAQHELGLRYLLGEGIPADTVQAINWIRKAAEKNLTAAKYNYAIMLINGIGVNWDPFSAFNYFRSAADDGMVQSQYVVGILYTDNLIVNRNWNLAYYWIKKAADGEFEPAVEIISRLEPKITKSVVDSLLSSKEIVMTEELENYSDPSNTRLTSNLGLSFIDFDAVQDSAVSITDSMIIADIEIMSADSLITELLNDSSYSFTGISTKEKTEQLKELANRGNPEAQTILGRMHEKGLFFTKNEITALAYYYRALRNDSPKATNLLWQLSGRTEFLNLIQKEAQSGNTEAEFVWYGLTSSGFDRRITLNDAIELLKNAASKKYIPALIELGLNYYSGRFLAMNQAAGLKIWEEAEKMGSKEATVRLTTARIFDSIVSTDSKKDFKILKEHAEKGSLLAQVSVAMCYENGVGVSKSKSEAANLFRIAAQRGSQFAYEELKRMYDELRPLDSEFNITN
jgi:uncharacterized protein